MTPQPIIKVLALEVVRGAVDELRRLPIHEHFPGFLALRRAFKASDGVKPIAVDTHLIERWITVEGGGEKRPFYRPFSHSNYKDPAAYWSNPNLAGSYSKSSVRGASPLAAFYSHDREHFFLPDNSAKLARDRMLAGASVPAWAVAAYFLRDFGFEFEGPGGLEEAVSGFRQEFAFEDDEDFDVLFDPSPPRVPFPVWFVEQPTIPGVTAPEGAADQSVGEPVDE